MDSLNSDFSALCLSSTNKVSFSFLETVTFSPLVAPEKKQTFQTLYGSQWDKSILYQAYLYSAKSYCTI